MIQNLPRLRIDEEFPCNGNTTIRPGSLPPTSDAASRRHPGRRHPAAAESRGVAGRKHTGKSREFRSELP